MRLFIAVTIDEKLRRELARAQTKLKQLLGQQTATWTAPENFHFTVKFIGDKSVDFVADVTSALTEIASQFSPFDMAVGGWGAFPRPERPSVIWIGAKNNSDLFSSLAKTVDIRLQLLGAQAEEKGYHTHLTIGRVKHPLHGLPEAFQQIPVENPGMVKVDSLVLMESELTPKGSIYNELGRFPLGR